LAADSIIGGAMVQRDLQQSGRITCRDGRNSAQLARRAAH
jgi:hypothetical protein